MFFHKWFKKDSKEVIEIEEPQAPLEEQKIFNFNCELMYLDDVNQTLLKKRKNATFTAQNPVSVYSDGKLIGAANVFVQNKVLVAIVSIDYNLPERLDIETGAKKYWVHIDGGYSIVGEKENQKIISVNVDKLHLKTSPVLDGRIQPI